MENAKTTLVTILSCKLSKANVQICLASILKDQPDFQRLNITASVADHFRDIAERWLTKHEKNYMNGDLLLKAFEAQTKPDEHELEFIHLSKHESIRTQIAALENLSELNVFSEDKEFVDGLRFYCLSITPENGKTITLYRFYSAKKELGRSKLFGIFMKDGQYDAVDNGLFLFDNMFDCFVSDGVLYICHKDAFQKIFRFYEMMKKTARETLLTIEKHVPISNFKEFSFICESHLQKLAKLKNIASKPYLQSLTISDLKKVISRFNLPVQTIGEGDDEKLQFDPKDKWAILRLLDDDYLESLMTGNHYEVNSKRTMDGK